MSDFRYDGGVLDKSKRYFEKDYEFQDPKLKAYNEILWKLDGWYSNEDLMYLDWLSKIPYNRQGGVCELGVHMGKMFHAMMATVVDDSHSYAVDLFNDLDMYNVSLSGGYPKHVWRPKNLPAKRDPSVNQRAFFRSTGEEWDRQGIIDFSKCIIKSDDTNMMTPEDFDNNKFKFVSIDAGHHYHNVVADLKLAEQIVSRNGVVIVDDWMSMEWYGVTQATMEYMSNGGLLVPFCGHGKKLYMCRYNAKNIYLDAMAEFPWKRHEHTLCGNKVYNICDTRYFQHDPDE